MKAFNRKIFVIFKTIQLGLLRFSSNKDYLNLQKFIAEETLKEIALRGYSFSDLSILELGAGRGGYSKVFNQISKNFLATDFEMDDYFTKHKIPFQKLDVSKQFFFNKNTFDFIYCSSVIEHLENPSLLIKESLRILKPQGGMMLSFPPFYSLALMGGHMFKPFHFFGEKVAIKLTNIFKGKNCKGYATCFGSFGLYPLSINKVKKMILNTGFETVDIYTRMFPINTAKWPGFLKDLATWHVCFLVRKP